MRLRTGTIVALVSLAILHGTGMQAADDAERCSAKSISGSYGFSITGTNYASDVAWALVGQFVSDGAGNFTGGGTQSVKGRVGRVKFTGKYQIQDDCSGTAAMAFEAGPSAAIDFVVVDDGNEIRLIVADQGTLETGSAQRIVSSRQVTRTTDSR